MKKNKSLIIKICLLLFIFFLCLYIGVIEIPNSVGLVSDKRFILIAGIIPLITAIVTMINHLLQILKEPQDKREPYNNLPPGVYGFVGRKKEINELARVIKPGSGVHVITGMGGVGKTELAKKIAAKIYREFDDGVIWINCGQLNCEKILENGIKRLSEEKEVEIHLDIWYNLINRKKLLIVLDDIQPKHHAHKLFPPATSKSVILITTKFEHHPSLKEYKKIHLNLLNKTEAEEMVEIILKEDILELKDDYAVLFDLVGYLPLMLRIALYTIRNSEFTVTEMCKKLREAGALEMLDKQNNADNEKNLQATFQIAFDNISNDLQIAFTVCALFNKSPSFSTSAFEDVLDDNEASKLLHELQGASLIEEVEPNRWSLHVLLREFASTKLELLSRNNPDLFIKYLKRLINHYKAIAEKADALYVEGKVTDGVFLFDLERENIRYSYECIYRFLLENPNIKDDEYTDILQLVSDYNKAFTYCIDFRLYKKTYISWLEKSIAAEIPSDRKSESKFSINLGLAYEYLGDPNKATKLFEYAVEKRRENSDRSGESADLINLGIAFCYIGDKKKAIELTENIHKIAQDTPHSYLDDINKAKESFEAALNIKKEIGDLRGQGADLEALGIAYSYLDDINKAREFFETALNVKKDIGDTRGQSADFGNLGIVYSFMNDINKAFELFEEALKIDQEIGDLGGKAVDLGNLGVAYSEYRDAKKSIKLFEDAIKVKRKFNDRYGECVDLGNLGIAYIRTKDYKKARICLYDALEIMESIKSPDADIIKKVISEINNL